MILPKIRNAEAKRYSLNEEQTRRFIGLVQNSDRDEDVKRILMFLLFTGTRIGECLALSWNDIDFENRSIHIRHKLTNANGNLFLDTPKTKSSVLTIGMNETVYKLLKEQKEYCEQLSIIY